jgi:2,4-dienoyl-CoA reductase (NADPH2)
MREWGVGDPERTRGGLDAPEPQAPPRQVYLLQRKDDRVGAGLAKTSGWVHRAALKARGVEMIAGVNYERIDDAGLHVSYGPKRERARLLEVDDVVICAGQEPRRDLFDALQAGGANVQLAGGADVALELDAKRAIDQGTRIAAAL